MFAGRDIRKEVFCGSFKMTEVHPSSATHDFSQSSVLNNSQKEHCRHLIHDTFMAVFKSIKKSLFRSIWGFGFPFFIIFLNQFCGCPRRLNLNPIGGIFLWPQVRRTKRKINLYDSITSTFAINSYLRNSFSFVRSFRQHVIINPF